MSSQKFIARNRAPRVQIEYDVELYGAEKKIQLPVRDGGPGRPVGETGRTAAARRGPEVPRHRRRQLRQPHEGDEAACRVPGAQHADRRGQHQRGHHLREHGRLLSGGGGAQGGCAEQAARGPAAAVQPHHLHGRQERRRGAGRRRSCRIRRCCRRWPRRREAGRRAAS